MMIVIVTVTMVMMLQLAIKAPFKRHSAFKDDIAAKYFCKRRSHDFNKLPLQKIALYIKHRLYVYPFMIPKNCKSYVNIIQNKVSH